MLRQGTHHGAHTSRRTVTGEPSTCSSKVRSVTSAGAAEAGRGARQRAHTGSSPRRTRFDSTRLDEPHDGQGTAVRVTRASVSRLARKCVDLLGFARGGTCP